MHFSTIAVVLCLCLSMTYALPSCGTNEVFEPKSCGNPCTQRHCSNVPSKPCPMYCMSNGGCECKPGFVRNAKDECTEERSCAGEKVEEVLLAQPTCGVNEVFVATSCGNRCMQRHCPGLPQKPCPLYCTHGGCECQPGFVRNANDECTEERSCGAGKVEEVLVAQPTCGVNEVFVATSCGNRCMQRHCPGLPQKPCPLYCTHGGCECQPGFVRNAKDECTEERSCGAEKVELAQLTCGNNEVFVPTSCGNRCMQRHCNGVPQKPCPLFCMHGGCECKPGFIRNANDECNDEKSC